MNMIDRVKLSAEKTVSKGRNGINSVIVNVRNRISKNIEHTSVSEETEDPIIIENEKTVDTDLCIEQDMCMTQSSEIEEETSVAESESVPTPLPLVRRLNSVTRSYSASSRDIDKKTAPRGLLFVGTIALVFASLYLMRLFTNLGSMQEEMPLIKRIVGTGMLLSLFYQYISYVINIFRLKSGLRWSWSTMVRSSATYVLLMILAESHVFDWLPFNLVAYPSWILMLAMTIVMVYMLLPSVREYYMPAYADMVPLKKWLLFIIWMDPYKTVDADTDSESV